MNRATKKPSAKDISLRIAERWLELTFGRYSERNIFYAWLILLILSLIFAAIVLNWATGIKTPQLQPDIAVSVTRLNQNQSEVMITYIGKDTSLKYLTYNSSSGSGFINRTTEPSENVRDAGETGTIPVPDDDNLEISATLSNARTIKIYSKRA